MAGGGGGPSVPRGERADGAPPRGAPHRGGGGRGRAAAAAPPQPLPRGPRRSLLWRQGELPPPPPPQTQTHAQAHTRTHTCTPARRCHAPNDVWTQSPASSSLQLHVGGVPSPGLQVLIADLLRSVSADQRATVPEPGGSACVHANIVGRVSGQPRSVLTVRQASPCKPQAASPWLRNRRAP